MFCRAEDANYSFQTAKHEALRQYILFRIFAGHALAGMFYCYGQSFRKSGICTAQTNEMHSFIYSCLIFNLTSIGPCIVIYFYSKTNKMHQCIKFILFWNDTLRVSDGLSVHHQQLKTVHTAVLFDKCLLLYVQS